MKPTKQPKEWTVCPTCSLPYAFIRVRLSLYEQGKRYEICNPCAILREKTLSPPDVKVG